MTDLKTDLRSKGYVVSPNNIYSLPGCEMYAGGPGIPEPKRPLVVHVLYDRIRVFKPMLFGKPFTKTTHWDTATVAVFASADDFIEWCKEHGQMSEPGMPAFMFGD